MKKSLIPMLMLALSGAAGLNAHADAVTSVNAVGMVKVEIQPGNFAFLTLSLINGEEDPLVADLFNDLPAQSQVFIWNNQNQTYIDVFKHPTLGWFPQNVTIPRGTGFFVKPAGTEVTEIIFSGEVPGSVTHEFTEIPIKPGLNAIGFPYPVEITVEDSLLSEIAENSDQVFIWDNETNSYKNVFRHPSLGWFPQNVTIPVGAAIFLRSNRLNETTYTAQAPYSWPNN
ncbi:MAG: hypothetical protein JJU05_19170 [Verrucomicrobia bacterium]|nr:hypothetical protein [Verrucomicrobiota bacterium]